MNGTTIFRNDRLPEMEDSRGERCITEESVSDLRYVDVSGRRYCRIKRLLDVVFSLLAMVLLLIPSGIIALMIYIDDPGKVLFRQNRVGLHGERFKLYKFRTMRVDTPKYISTDELKDPKRYITRIGRVLRKSSLDEIPQLINVLKGDMSLIGPRPLISDEWQMHQYRLRFGVYNLRPGITGLAQINGRDFVKPTEKIHWDVEYLEHFGFWQDVYIFFATLPKAFLGKDVELQKKSQEGTGLPPDDGEKRR